MGTTNRQLRTDEPYGGLPTELSWKIFLDRYTVKDPERDFQVGDLAVLPIVEDRKWSKKEIGEVVEVRGETVRARVLTGPDKGQVLEFKRVACDRPIETSLRQVAERVARGLAAVEPDEERRQLWARQFADEIAALRVVPGGRIWAGAGTGTELTLFNCFVIPSPRDSRDGIVETLGQMMEIMARGGGVGINVSSLRPYRAPVRSVNGRSSGAVSWMEIYSYATGLIEQAGARRGALMLQLDCRHPDLQHFIDVKKQPGRVENANISVRVTDEFMQAVKEDREWVFWFPDTAHPDYDRIWRGDFDDWERRGLPKVIYGTRPAREVWREIVKAAWECAEPGVVFATRHEKESNSWYFNPLVCTNPCVTGDTLVYTEHGLRRVTELFLEGAENRVVTDGRFGAPHTVPASRVFLTGFKPVYRLVTREGYEVRLTADHRVMTDRGWVEARHLRPGDRIHVLDRPGAFGTEGSYELGLVLGWLVGDGTLKRDRAVLSFFGEEKRELAPVLAAAVNAVVRPSSTRRRYEVGVVEVEGRDEARVQSQRLLELAEEYGLADCKAAVPEEVLCGSREMQVGFLRALFSADGHVETNQRGHRNVVLSSYNLSLLQDVQRLLLNFGIFSRIYRNRRRGGPRSLPDGKGGRKTYVCEPLHDLRIMGASLVRFCRDIGFVHQRKQQRLEQALALYKRGPYEEEFVAHFEALVPDGEEPVFDLHVPEVHAFVANGIVVHNCAEQPLPAWGVCTLGHINLARMYDEKRRDVDWQRLRHSVRVLVRLLDDVIDASPYFMEEIRKNQMEERRIGAGTMGLGELLIRLGLRYGSPEAVEFTDRLYRFIAVEAYRMSVEVAKEKGPFPRFDAEKYLQSGFMRRMPEEIRELVRRHGIRNVTVLTQAPTGTVGTMVDTSTGIEPYYAFEFVRRSRLGEDKQYVRVVKEWMDAHPGEPLPDHFVTANDLTPEEHVRMQAAIQRWTDSSISKTANCPADYTLEDTERLYMLAYDLGCKGVTIYRDRSRYEQVLIATPGPTAEEGRAADNGAARPAAVPAQWGRIRPMERPRRLQGITMRKETPLGNLYITLNTHEGRPFEVFCQIGKAGSDVAAFTEAIARLVSICFRCGIDPEEVIQQLAGIGGSRHVGFGPHRVRSVPDALAQALEEFLRGAAAEDPEAVRARGQLTVFEGAPGAAADGAAAPVPVAAGAAAEGRPPAGAGNGHRVASFDLCPECGAHGLVYQEGCVKCLACGHSEC